MKYIKYIELILGTFRACFTVYIRVVADAGFIRSAHADVHFLRLISAEAKR